MLCAAGTKLQRIEDDGSLTTLTGAGFDISEARTEGLFHSADKYSDLLLIQNQNPDLIGAGDTPVKYDGNAITKWGVVAPGSEETLRETFDTLVNFSITGGSGSIDATTTLDGSALKLTATSVTLQIDRTSLSAFAVDDTIPNRAQLSVYVPRGQIANLSDSSASTAITVRVGTNLATAYHEFHFSRGELLEGWQNLPLDFSAPDTTVGAPGVAALTAFRIIVRSVSASSLITNIRFDRFLTYDRGTLVAAEGAAGSVFASGRSWTYKVTYNTRYGHSSNAGPAAVEVTTTAARSSFSITGIPTSQDPQVISRTIWRTVGGGAIHLFHSTVNNNTDTTMTDTTSDVGLGDTSPPEEGDVSDDNTPPPKAGIVKRWKDTIFLGALPDRPETIVWSDVGEAESFPTLNEAQLDAKVTTFYETYSGLVIETELGKWQVTGDNPEFRFDKIINNIGCVGRRAAGETRIQGWTIDRDGMRLYDLNNPTKISETIRDKFDDEFDKTNIELIHSTHSKRRNLITMFVPNSSGVYTGANYMYQYPVDDVQKGWWWQLDLPSSQNFLHVHEIEDSNGDFHLYAAADDGMVYELFAQNEKNWTLVDGTTQAITTQFQTKYIRAASNEGGSEDFSGRILPRMIEIRHDGDADMTWTVVVETATGPDQATATSSTTVPVVFGEDETLMRYPIPATIQPGEYVRLTLTNSDSSKAGGVTGLRLYFIPRPGQFPIETTQMSPILAQSPV